MAVRKVEKLVPATNATPPTAFSYHLTEPALAEALKITLPLSQVKLGVVEVMDGVVFTVATTGVLVSDVQPLKTASA